MLSTLDATSADLTRPSGARVLDALHHAGISSLAALPDLWTSSGLLFPAAVDRRFRLIRVCKEDEAIGFCAGTWMAGQRAVAMMQHTGFLDSVNALRGVASESNVPICLIVGLLHKEPDRPATESSFLGLRMVQPILKLLGIEEIMIDSDADVAGLSARIDAAFTASKPLAVLFGRSPVA